MAFVRSFVASLVACIGLVVHAVEPAYQSPYRVAFGSPTAELIPDILHGDRATPQNQSSVAFADWYTPATKRRYGPWGPPLAHLPVPALSDGKSAEWKRERVIAIGLRYVGLGYQHHHVADWDPPGDWPWKPVVSGHNGKGLDCSNFTTMAYTLALGIKPPSAIEKQATMTVAPLPDGRSVSVRRIERPASHEAFAAALQTGDLLFMKNDAGRVSHVVLWVGTIGRSPDGTPLILDSTDMSRKDHRGMPIPRGVQLRPFPPKSWYFRNLTHALRLIPDEPPR